MIKRLEVEDIVKILVTDDIDIEKFFPGEKGEIVQWLVSVIDSPAMFIYGNITDTGKLKGLMIAVNNVYPPISNFVSILYFHSSNNKETNQEIVDRLSDWARKAKAKKVSFICQNIRVFHKYGATQQAILGGWDL